MPRDVWTELNRYLADIRAEAVEEVLRGSLTPESYKATCKKISTIDEIADKMKDLLGNVEAPGEDV